MPPVVRPVLGGLSSIFVMIHPRRSHWSAVNSRPVAPDDPRACVDPTRPARAGPTQTTRAIARFIPHFPSMTAVTKKTGISSKRFIPTLSDAQFLPILTVMRAKTAPQKLAMPACSDNRFLKTDYGWRRLRTENLEASGTLSWLKRLTATDGANLATDEPGPNNSPSTHRKGASA